MISSTAGASGRAGQPDADVVYISTQATLPPVALVDRSPISVRHRIVLGLVATVGAVAWAVIAAARGETVDAV